MRKFLNQSILGYYKMCKQPPFIAKSQDCSNILPPTNYTRWCHKTFINIVIELKFVCIHLFLNIECPIVDFLTNWKAYASKVITFVFFYVILRPFAATHNSVQWLELFWAYITWYKMKKNICDISRT